MSNPESAAAPIRIAVLNDHLSFLQALERYLEQEPDLEVVSKGHASPRTLEPVIATQPDVAIIDPETHGHEIDAIIHRLRGALPEARVIVLTLNDSESFKQTAFAAGAHDFILKTEAADRLVPAIRQVRTTA